jgi:hypothetical protein
MIAEALPNVTGATIGTIARTLSQNMPILTPASLP